MLRFAALATLVIAAAARAQEATSQPNIRDLMHARDFGMAGAYTAHGLGASAVTGNPAAITLYRRYQLEASGAWDPTNAFGFGTVAVADSQTSQLGGGLAYDLVSFGSGEQRRTAHINTLALAFPLADFLHIGAGIRNVIETGYIEKNGITLDAGLMIRLFESLVIGGAAHNLIDIANPDMTPWYSASAAFVAGILTLAADVRIDAAGGEAHLAYAFGGEYVLGEGLPVRLGYQYDGIAHTSYLGVGIGLITEGGGIDLGYRHELGGLNGRMLALTLKMSVR